MVITKNDIIKAIEDGGGSISMASKILGISRVTFYKYIKKEKIGREVNKLIEEIKAKIREERKNQKIVYSGSKMSMVINKTEAGSILSEKMQNILSQTKGRYTTIYNLAVDQLNIRELMSMTEEQYNSSKINFKEYVFIANQLHRTFSLITKTAEDIAKMKLDGKTPTEVYDEMFQFMRNIIETFKELINDETVERGDIIAQFEERIKLRDEDI